jgi:TPR repeat protein
MWCAVAILAALSAANLSAQIAPSLDDTFPVEQPVPTTVGKQIASDIQTDLKTASNYENGCGVTKDPVKAAYWFRKAANLGDPAAENQMGYLYVWGIGVSRDTQQAIRWFARAAGSGLQQAKLNMAVLFLQGIGVRRDPVAGRAMLEDLAYRHNHRAEDYLGELYLEGRGVPKDTAKAEEYFRRAAEGKNPEGEYEMGHFYAATPGHVHNLKIAEKFLRRSANAGYVPAMHALGVLLTMHRELAVHRSGDPLTLFRRAAEGGIWQSAAMLGVFASGGKHQPPDPATAYRWFTIAAGEGGSEAAAVVGRALAECRAALSPSQQEDQERAADGWLRKHGHKDAFIFDGHRDASLLSEIYAIPVGSPD